ncbi:MAG: LytTR family transcriptional regulator [Saprospiraceae bacterium]|nr:LytTR family transcriptional regulator [Saprospiraceae bacterium]
MAKVKPNFAGPNSYLPTLLLMGPCLGVAGYFMGSAENIGEALVIHSVITLSIGYGLLFIIFNKPWLLSTSWSKWQQTAGLAVLFIVVGVLGSEIEQVVRKLLFEQGPYQFFRLDGGHVFNAILSPVLGFTFDRVLGEIDAKQEPAVVPKPKTVLQKIPVKKGEHTIFIQVENLAYIEASDMYAYLHLRDGQKHLCDYALGFLENRLPSTFARIHRKYIVNQNQVAKIAPHLKGRYELTLADKQSTKLVSSNSYTQVIKAMIKIVD